MVGSTPKEMSWFPASVVSQLLGWGRFGEVWKASGPGGITVAVKIIPLSSRQGLSQRNPFGQTNPPSEPCVDHGLLAQRSTGQFH